MNDEEVIKEAEILNETKTELVPENDEKTKEMSAVLDLLSNLDTEIEVSIIVTRLNDKQFKGQFRLPCTVDSQVEVLAWDCQPFPDNHYEYIRKTYGGGCYRFQLRYDDGKINGFKQAWRAVLLDPAELSEKERLLKAENEPVKIETLPNQFLPNPQPAEKALSRNDFFAQIIEEEKQRAILREIFSPTQPTEQIQTVEPKKTKLDFVMEIYKETQDVAIRNKIVNSALDISDPISETRPIGFLESVADTFANSPTLQAKTGQLLESGLSLITLAASRFFSPPSPPATVDINAFRQPRNESPPVPPLQNEPQPTQTAQFEPFVIEDTLPFIEIGESKNV